MSDQVRILLAGGGSGGSATPVIAVAERLRELAPRPELLFVGTRTGPERSLARAAGLPFAAVPSGKLRRYWSWRNPADAVAVLAGLLVAARLVRRFRPQAALGAGGFASVPSLAAAAALGCRVHVHQQDAVAGLANRLLLPLARSCSVSLAASLPHFPSDRTVLVGNPVRPSVLCGDPARARETFGLEPGLPLIIVTGGGTGALGLNRLVVEAAPTLVDRCQIVHLTGRGRGVPVATPLRRYRQLEFVTTEMADLLSGAALVVTRAGMGTLSELAALGKPAVLVPMPESHQAANAAAFAERGAAVVLEQRGLDGERLAAALLALLEAPDRLLELAANMRQSMPADAADRLARLVLELARSAGGGDEL
jgi:UDP-N-acetylglucosamine--N-acetylmuramyl-(pentapeptide) pyrophosphoryl-undecaprenol N-acetylglucosamine transferase